VPQLRNIASLAPYFHDNSAATLEEVVDYFNSDAYNQSVDGREHPIHLGQHERAALLAFLRVL
jgi:cytochrome c peroxidase